MNLVVMDFMFIIFLPFACAFDPFVDVTNATGEHARLNQIFNILGKPFLKTLDIHAHSLVQ